MSLVAQRGGAQFLQLFQMRFSLSMQRDSDNPLLYAATTDWMLICSFGPWTRGRRALAYLSSTAQTRIIFEELEGVSRSDFDFPLHPSERAPIQSSVEVRSSPRSGLSRFGPQPD